MQLLRHVVLGERAGIGAVETVLDDVVPITEAVLGREELLGRQEDLLDEFVEASPSEDEST